MSSKTWKLQLQNWIMIATSCFIQTRKIFVSCFIFLKIDLKVKSNWLTDYLFVQQVTDWNVIALSVKWALFIDWILLNYHSLGNFRDLITLQNYPRDNFNRNKLKQEEWDADVVFPKKWREIMDRVIRYVDFISQKFGHSPLPLEHYKFYDSSRVQTEIKDSRFKPDPQVRLILLTITKLNLFCLCQK